MSVEIIIPIAAVVVLLLLLAWLFKILKASIKTMLIIAAILIILQVAFGINSQEFLQEVMQIVERLYQVVIGN